MAWVVPIAIRADDPERAVIAMWDVPLPIPGVGRLEYVKDTEGIILGVLEPAAR